MTSRELEILKWAARGLSNKELSEKLFISLRTVKAQVRFLSVEPLLESLGEMDLRDIHWVIVGGESGPKARPMQKEWAEEIRIQCEESDIAFFFKQWGGWGADGKKRAKKENGRVLNGRIFDEMPAISMAP